MGTNTGLPNISRSWAFAWTICLYVVAIGLPEAAVAATSDWVITQDRDGFTMMANRQDINLRISLNADPARTKLLSSERHPIHKHIEVIRYNASGDDAHQLVVSERAVLFNTRSRKLLGDFPLRFVARRAPSDQQPRQPKWQVDYRSIKIFDPDTRQTTLLPMK